MSLKKTATPHLIPGTDILKNKPGFTNQARLDQFERMAASSRMTTIPEGDFSSEHLKKIHKHLFSDVYEWAGQFRDVPIEKGTTVFCRPEFVDQEANKLTKAVDMSKLKNLNHKAFVGELSHIVGELNVVHPFLEGNGRTLRAYAEKICKTAGYNLDITKLQGEEWNNAFIRAYSQDNKGIEAILQKRVTPTAVKRLQLNRGQNENTRGPIR
ncbi:Fic/DOC family protein [Desulfospira joergensenii]|uniref:Fic/DOC family protein n=1 Tax=Desulfospira joergensenii TaxID=53329 RepID=UPI0003B6EF17|nr:Fic family protein [Desulfospira joergensenii]